jgi:hypothetical protein
MGSLWRQQERQREGNGEPGQNPTADRDFAGA